MSKIKGFAISMSWLIGSYVALYIPIHWIRWAVEDIARNWS